ncbi:VOC family protein [Rummeliibacillus pycnus]|uniref:VOC family protein n=1 Tax=Rummeliibacillus pycnus TaxID=101070 RepID=UPI0037C94AA3
MTVNPYLIFNGNAREAVEFYGKAFQTEKPQIMTFGDADNDPNSQLPEEAKDLVMHANIKVSGSDIMFSDTFPGSPYTVGNNVTLAVVSDDEAYIRSAFSVLQDGGEVMMELQKTFWSPCYGSVKDRFGVEWQFNLDDGTVFQPE